MNTLTPPKENYASTAYYNPSINISTLTDDHLILPEIDVREITKFPEKQKWMKSFIRNYSGAKNPLNSAIFGERCKYFVGSIGDKDVGFIRITNYTKLFKEHYNEPVWNASDAFVKHSYRGKSVLRQLLEYVIKNCNVKMLRLETDRLIRNYQYYSSLGFTYSQKTGDGSLCISVTEDLKNPIIMQNKIT
jgi:GNAT superfamily N-acetyltransferase